MKFHYDNKTNTLYINSDLIMPDLTKYPIKERSKIIKDWFALGYEERINRSPYKLTILNEIAKYENPNISEFSEL